MPGEFFKGGRLVDGSSTSSYGKGKNVNCRGEAERLTATSQVRDRTDERVVSPLLDLTRSDKWNAVGRIGHVHPSVLRPYRRYRVGTTNMLSNVDVARPHRMTIAIGV
jgi:hypothetical protein